jgi:hypothetical protein
MFSCPVHVPIGHTLSGCAATAEYIQKNYLATESYWPYTASNGTCTADKVAGAPTRFQIATAPGHAWVTWRSKEALMAVRKGWSENVCVCVCVCVREG